MKEFSSLYELFEAIPHEQAAIDYFKSIRWARWEFCPYCGHGKVYGLKSKQHWKCAECRQKFSIQLVRFSKIARYRCASGLPRSG